MISRLTKTLDNETLSLALPFFRCFISQTLSSNILQHFNPLVPFAVSIFVNCCTSTSFCAPYTAFLELTYPCIIIFSHLFYSALFLLPPPSGHHQHWPSIHFYLQVHPSTLLSLLSSHLLHFGHSQEDMISLTIVSIEELTFEQASPLYQPLCTSSPTS